MTGQGKAIVLAVGSNTVLAKRRKPGDLSIDEQETELEKKLVKTSEQIGKYVWMFVAINIVTSILFVIIYSFAAGKGIEFITKFIQVFVVAVVLLIVAVPEGLPVAVSIAMAMSVSQM